MANEKRLLKVFLCHTKVDKPKVRDLYRYLHRRRIKPWLDEVDLVGGQDWQVEIPKALATSDAIIICLSKNSVDKEGYIQKEIKFALDKALEMPEGRIFIIPVRFEECDVPFLLSRYQWVDLFDEAGYTRMMRALKFRASQLERASVEISPKESEEEKPEIGYSSPEKEDVKSFEKNVQEGQEKVISENQEPDVVKNINEKKESKGVELPEAQEAKKQADQTAIRRSSSSPLVIFLGGGNFYWNNSCFMFI